MAYDPSEVLVLYLGAGESGGYSPVGHEERLSCADGSLGPIGQ